MQLRALNLIVEVVQSVLNWGRTAIARAMEPTPAVDLYPIDRPQIGWAKYSRLEVRERINDGRVRNAQGGFDWSREDYIAYALARPVKYASSVFEEEAIRTARFRRHEFIANDNINYYELAYILWNRRLVSVDGSFYGDEGARSVPYQLIEYLEVLAPWLPRPPHNRYRKAA